MQYTLSGPDLNQLARYATEDPRALPEGPGGRRRRLEPHRRQPRGARRDRPRARRATSASTSRTSPTRSSSSSAGSRSRRTRKAGNDYDIRAPRQHVVTARTSTRYRSMTVPTKTRRHRAAVVGRAARARRRVRRRSTGWRGSARSRSPPTSRRATVRATVSDALVEDHRGPAHARRVPRGARRAHEGDGPRRAPGSLVAVGLCVRLHVPRSSRRSSGRGCTPSRSCCRCRSPSPSRSCRSSSSIRSCR